MAMDARGERQISHALGLSGPASVSQQQSSEGLCGMLCWDWGEEGGVGRMNWAVLISLFPLTASSGSV